MKITRKQLRLLISEAAEQELSPEQKLIKLVRLGELYQAEALADAMEVDLFPLVAGDWKAVDALFQDAINVKDLADYLYSVADNSFESDAGFFNALLLVLPNYPSLSMGMSYEEIVTLINNDPERFNIYKDYYMALGMSYPDIISQGGKIIGLVKDWIAGIMFLKLESMYNNSPGEFSIVDALESIGLTP